MTRWLSLLGLLVLAAVLSACGGQPQISITDSTLELGDVANGEVITREVNVQNEGQAELVIEAVTTSCGCTQARLEPTIIPAGESGTLHIEFDSGAHGPELTGPFVRQIFIASNDPQQPEVVVEMVTNILPPNEP